MIRGLERMAKLARTWAATARHDAGDGAEFKVEEMVRLMGAGAAKRVMSYAQAVALEAVASAAQAEADREDTDPTQMLKVCPACGRGSRG